MAIKPGAREQKSNIRKKLIMDTALLLFREYGFDHVAVGDICEKAGVSVGSFYNFYGSKENLLYTCIYTLRDEYITRHFHYDGAKPFPEQLTDFFLVNANYNKTVPSKLLSDAIGAWITPKIAHNTDPERPLFHLLNRLVARGVREGEFYLDYSVEAMTTLVRNHMTGLSIFYAGNEVSGDMYTQFSKDTVRMLLKR